MTEEELVEMLMENPENVHKSIWNVAIEKAAKLAEQQNVPQSYVSKQIRKLKK